MPSSTEQADRDERDDQPRSTLGENRRQHQPRTQRRIPEQPITSTLASTRPSAWTRTPAPGLPVATTCGKAKLRIPCRIRNVISRQRVDAQRHDQHGHAVLDQHGPRVGHRQRLPEQDAAVLALRRTGSRAGRRHDGDRRRPATGSATTAAQCSRRSTAAGQAAGVRPAKRMPGVTRSCAASEPSAGPAAPARRGHQRRDPQRAVLPELAPRSGSRTTSFMRPPSACRATNRSAMVGVPTSPSAPAARAAHRRRTARCDPAGCAR